MPAPTGSAQELPVNLPQLPCDRSGPWRTLAFSVPFAGGPVLEAAPGGGGDAGNARPALLPPWDRGPTASELVNESFALGCRAGPGGQRVLLRAVAEMYSRTMSEVDTQHGERAAQVVSRREVVSAVVEPCEPRPPSWPRDVGHLVASLLFLAAAIYIAGYAVQGALFS